MEKRGAIRSKLKSLLERKGDLRPFSDAESLVASGRMESLDVLEVVAFLEEQFGLDVGAFDFDPSRFASVDEVLETLNRGAG